MPRPRASAQQQLRAYELHKESLGPTAIWEALIKEYGDDAISQRTISTWIHGFKQKTKSREERGGPDLDVPFEWQRLEEYGLPWEAGRYLLDMWVTLTERRDRLTVRQARWLWRVHLAVPDMEDKITIDYWAAHLVRYELFKDVLGETIDTSGLMAILAHEPWADEEKLVAYMKAITDRRIQIFPEAWWEDSQFLDRVREALEQLELTPKDETYWATRRELEGNLQDMERELQEMKDQMERELQERREFQEMKDLGETEGHNERNDTKAREE